MEMRDVLLRLRLDAAVLEAWVAEGWLLPGGALGERDIARACLIRDLREDLGVNDEGVGVVLDLVDQLHGARLALRRVAEAMRRLPEPLRADMLAATAQAGDPRD
jgi:chaperone modulatory protein CbpM